jgi:hypothetical protein
MNRTELIQPPKVKLLIAPGYGYGLDGWKDFERWAIDNDSVYRTIKLRCSAQGVSEIDMLRLMVACMTEDRALYHKIAAKYANRFGLLLEELIS